jgi:rod shape-determining protein MreC
MLRKILDAVALLKEYLVFALLAAVSILLIAHGSSPQVRVLRSLAVTSAGVVQEILDIFPNHIALQRENQALRALNLSLQDEVSRLREARLENIRLRRLLGLRGRETYPVVAARVIGRTLLLLNNTVTLDVGERDGIRATMPIITERGLAGSVVTTSSRYAVGRILLNRDMRVSARIQRSRIDGIIRWNGGSRLSLENVAKTLDVRLGDVVVTSEYSSLFPAGIRIGTVARRVERPGSLFQTVDVEPSVRFSTLEEVFVLAVVPDSSRLVLEQNARR